MSKIYTAAEMREMADFFDRNAEMVRRKVLSNAILANIHEVIPMLRQAADMMESKKRKRKYEYALKWGDGVIECKSDSIKRTKERENGLNRRLVEPCVSIVRREVGEWEEVK